MALTKIVNGIQVTCSEEEEAEIRAQWAANDAAQAQDLAANGYKYQRQKAYLDVGDQLDFLWHSMDTGETPKCQAFYDSRLAVKQKYPKPTS